MALLRVGGLNPGKRRDELLSNYDGEEPYMPGGYDTPYNGEEPWMPNNTSDYDDDDGYDDDDDDYGDDYIPPEPPARKGDLKPTEDDELPFD